MIYPTEKGFRVEGAVTFNTVAAFRLQGEKWLAKSTLPQIEIDLSDMKDQDASSISLLLCWMRFAKKNKLYFVNAPQSLQRMLNMFGLKEITVNS